MNNSSPQKSSRENVNNNKFNEEDICQIKKFLYDNFEKKPLSQLYYEK